MQETVALKGVMTIKKKVALGNDDAQQVGFFERCSLQEDYRVEERDGQSYGGVWYVT